MSIANYSEVHTLSKADDMVERHEDHGTNVQGVPPGQFKSIKRRPQNKIKQRFQNEWVSQTGTIFHQQKKSLENTQTPPGSAQIADHVRQLNTSCCVQ